MKKKLARVKILRNHGGKALFQSKYIYFFFFKLPALNIKQIFTQVKRLYRISHSEF